MISCRLLVLDRLHLGLLFKVACDCIPVGIIARIAFSWTIAAVVVTQIKTGFCCYRPFLRLLQSALCALIDVWHSVRVVVVGTVMCCFDASEDSAWCTIHSCVQSSLI